MNRSNRNTRNWHRCSTCHFRNRSHSQKPCSECREENSYCGYKRIDPGNETEGKYKQEDSRLCMKAM